MSKRASMRKIFGEKLTTFSNGQFLSLDKRMWVWHIGGGVGEVDSIGQVPLLLLLLRSPGKGKLTFHIGFGQSENFWLTKISVWFTFDPDSDALQRPGPVIRLPRYNRSNWIWILKKKDEESTLSRAYRSPGLPPKAGWVVGAEVKRGWAVWGGSQSRA